MQESEGVLCMRVSFRIALAGQVIGVSALYEQTRTFCKNYLTDAPASFEVAVTPADIAFEREKNDREAAVEGHAPGNFSDEYLETLALYRKIVERLLEWDTLLFHGSCISVDSKAYLFTAKSGTGKSTHTQLYFQFSYRIRHSLIDERSELCPINMTLHWHRCAAFTEQLYHLRVNDALHLFQCFFL